MRSTISDPALNWWVESAVFAEFVWRLVKKRMLRVISLSGVLLKIMCDEIINLKIKQILD
jgi:hypothetical protein